MNYFSVLNLTPILAAAFFLLALPASFFGWGLVFRHLAGMRSGKLATTITLGVAVVIFVGGWLNWLGIAYTPTVVVVLAGGVGMLFFFVRRPMMQDLVDECRGYGAGGLILAALFILLLVLTQLPPWAYNPADDLQKYFTWPVRMLVTGTMVFSSTSAIGAESLGGQAFLHGITLSVLPPNNLAGLDGVFGIALCLLFALSLSRNRVAQTLSVLAVVVIHPQVVNISTLYVGAALIMASVDVSNESMDQSSLGQALLYAALLACKSTFAIFVVFHIVAVALSRSSIRSAVESGFRVGVWILVFLSPWFFLHVHHWLAGIGYRAPLASMTDPFSIEEIFSFTPLFYGASMMVYSLLIFGSAIVGIIVVWVTRRQEDCTLKSLFAAVVFLPAGHVIMYGIFGPLLVGQSMIERYYTPMIIALVPVVISLSLSRLTNHRFWLAVAASGFAVLLAFFGPSSGDRVDQLVNRRNQLAFEFAGNDYFIKHTTVVFSGSAQKQLRKAQNAIPAGAPILTGVDTAFQFDFARNPIYDIEPAGIANPWAALPKVHYLLLDMQATVRAQHRFAREKISAQGLHERQIAARCLDFYRCIASFAGQGRIIYQQENICVLEFVGDIPSRF